MDIWAWVFDLTRQLEKDGHRRLAELIDTFPDAVRAEQHARIDAMLPEALALARALELPWLDVFFRHWSLRSRVASRAQGEPALAEAVSLLEFAHRPETIDCPQSVCAGQDLASCYSRVDSQGYADERIAVAEDALKRIDPDWPCFTCISAELAEALVAAGRLDETKAFVERQIAALADVGESTPFQFSTILVDVALRQGNLEAALAATEMVEDEDELWDSQRVDHRLDRARVLARLGRTEEALRLLPSFDEIVGTPGNYRDWADAAQALIERGALPADTRWGAQLRRLAENLLRQGAYSGAYDLLCMAAAGALARRRPATAALALDAAQAAAQKLRRPERTTAALAELGTEAAAQAASGEDGFASPEALIASLEEAAGGDKRDFERVFERIAAGRRRWPEHKDLAMHEARCLLELGATAVAVERLVALKQGHPGDGGVLSLLGEVYLRERQDEALTALAAESAAVDPALGRWQLARLAQAQGDDKGSIAHLAELLKLVPTANNARRLWLEAARRLGDFRAMKEQAIALIALEPEVEQHHWDCMVAATMDGDWERVRQSAEAAGMKLSGSGPIDGEAELVRLRFRHDDEFQIRFAMRTGPVTARVVQSSLLPPDRFRDVVVFDARPLDRPEESVDEERRTPRLYAAIATLTRGNWRIFAIDGVHPGETAWNALDQQMEALGCDLQRKSPDGYQLHEPASGRAHAGIYAALAVPETLDVAAVHRQLEQATASFAFPLTWAGCAEAAGDHAAAARHRTLLAQWEGKEDEESV